MQLPGWMNHNLESRLPREIPTASGMQMIPLSYHPNGKKWRETKEPLEGERRE